MQQSDKRIAGYGEATGWILQTLAAQCVAAPITQVGHRVVHGGTEFRHSTLIDDRVCAALERIAELAPLHNPPALATIAAARSALPSATHLAAFDTSFFAAMPARAFLYPLPYDWYRQYGIRRFGFHGISHEWCAMRTAEMLRRTGDPSLRIVSCHLGSGCSATAVRGSTPVTTTMGFTPLEGLMMGTRSGSIDPGILFYLLEQQVNDLIRQDVPVCYRDDRHIGIGDIVSPCSGPRMHVRSTAEIRQLTLNKELLVEPLTDRYLLVGIVGEYGQQRISDLNKI